MNDDPSSLDETYANERVISTLPVVVRKRVLFGECDPAGVVYTPRFADYLSLAAGYFSAIVLRGGTGSLAGPGYGTPMKSMSVVFHHVLRCGDLIDMTVSIGEIRVRTFDIQIMARGLDGRLRFSGQLSPILVRADSFESVAIPDELRVRLGRHAAV